MPQALCRVSAITHANPVSAETFVFFAHVLRYPLADEWIEAATTCVTGTLAGAMYGCELIFWKRKEQLRGKEVIDGCLF